MSTKISNLLKSQLKADYFSIINHLKESNYIFEPLPSNFKAKCDSGEAYALAYPIQGVLKYHGFADLKENIAFTSSISFNNSGGYTVSYLRFDKSLDEDLAYLNGEKMIGEELKRVKQALNLIRNYSEVDTKAILISRNHLNLKGIEATGKGLGFSASGSAALGKAAISILYENDPDYLNNKKLLSLFSRFLSGSGCRNVLGGFSIWLSHPEIDSKDSIAIRLDNKNDKSWLENLIFITIPIYSTLKTKRIHKIVNNSLYFETWLKNRKNQVLKFLDSFKRHNIEQIGEIAEYDTLYMHSVILTSNIFQNTIAWKPITLEIMNFLRNLRMEGIKNYFTIDTGPSVVVIIHKKNKKVLMERIRSKFPELPLIAGTLGGPARVLEKDSPHIKELKKDLEKLKQI
jgi:diphosphomevalonate decarboxylase